MIYFIIIHNRIKSVRMKEQTKGSHAPAFARLGEMGEKPEEMVMVWELNKFCMMTVGEAFSCTKITMSYRRDWETCKQQIGWEPQKPGLSDSTGKKFGFQWRD